MKLDRSFYMERDAIAAAKDLLGKVLVTLSDEGKTSAMITETEAYTGINDRAAHVFNGRRTKRNEQMYAIGGTAYVYLCYGIHHLFNVVVCEAEEPQAVLIRAVSTLEGRPIMETRRKGRRTTLGPGTTSEALGITTADNGTDLTGHRIWIEDRGIRIPKKVLLIGPRIGVEYAGADALLPYRFRVAPSHLGT